jgi:hypothetical protein
MEHLYEAVVVTSDGTYRAYPLTPTLICVLEDGKDGILDTIELPEDCALASAPDNLTQTLLFYLFEMVRGLDIITATLRRRR